jgi:hypothetical protein
MGSSQWSARKRGSTGPRRGGDELLKPRNRRAHAGPPGPCEPFRKIPAVIPINRRPQAVTHSRRMQSRRLAVHQNALCTGPILPPEGAVRTALASRSRAHESPPRCDGRAHRLALEKTAFAHTKSFAPLRRGRSLAIRKALRAAPASAANKRAGTGPRPLSSKSEAVTAFPRTWALENSMHFLMAMSSGEQHDDKETGLACGHVATAPPSSVMNSRRCS